MWHAQFSQLQCQGEGLAPDSGIAILSRPEETPMRYSACIEMLFRDIPVFADRIRAAKGAGLDAVEFWSWSGKDLGAIEAALGETGLPLAGILCEPIANITNPATHDYFLAGVAASLKAAQRLG